LTFNKDYSEITKIEDRLSNKSGRSKVADGIWSIRKLPKKLVKGKSDYKRIVCAASDEAFEKMKGKLAEAAAKAGVGLGVMAIIAAVAGCCVLILLIVCIYCCCCKKKSGQVKEDDPTVAADTADGGPSKVVAADLSGDGYNLEFN